MIINSYKLTILLRAKLIRKLEETDELRELIKVKHFSIISKASNQSYEFFRSNKFVDGVKDFNNKAVTDALVQIRSRKESKTGRLVLL